MWKRQTHQQQNATPTLRRFTCQCVKKCGSMLRVEKRASDDQQVNVTLDASGNKSDEFGEYRSGQGEELVDLAERGDDVVVPLAA